MSIISAPISEYKTYYKTMCCMLGYVNANFAQLPSTSENGLKTAKGVPLFGPTPFVSLGETTESSGSSPTLVQGLCLTRRQ